MKKLLIILFCIVSGVAQAQTDIQIEDYIYQKPLASKEDTVTAFRIICIRNEIDLNSAGQKPEFLIQLISKSGEISMQRNISYKDMEIACEKKGFPENQWPAIIAQSYAAVFAGTKAQKLAVYTTMMEPYNITVKPNQ